MKKKLKNLAGVLFLPVAFIIYGVFFGVESLTINGEQYGESAGAIYGIVVVLVATGLLDLLMDIYKAIKE